MEKYLNFFYLGTGMICILSFILSLLYFYYGVRLAGMYSISPPNKDNLEIKERKIIHDKV